MEGFLKRVHARTCNPMHQLRYGVAVASLVFLIAAAPAPASVTIGQLPSAPPSPTCTTNFDYLQPSVTAGNLYNAREAGTITSWSTYSSGPGATYVLKLFRRTTDPDAFQVIAHAPPHNLSSGLNTVAVSLPVQSGDMIGLHESGLSNSCTFPKTGDTVLNRGGSLSDGASGTFSPQNNVRLNLSAVLAPSNGFTLGGIARDRKTGTATITVTASNPGLVALTGKGLKKRSKTLAVPGPVTLGIATAGKTKRRLQRKGRVTLPLTFTFWPTGGDPSTQTVNLKLRKNRQLLPV
ncbi:MAG: hypothetical protein QOI84_1308 [Solirubrobacterales bacterium]|nr:hypothetical protein [Solirubrobacterales bacterium]